MAFSFHLSHFYLSSLLNNAGALGELDNLGDIAKSQARYGVGTTIVNGYATRGGVVYLGTGETNVRHVASQFILHLWRDEIWSRTIDGLPRLLQVEQGRAKAVHIAIARTQHTMVEHQPTLGCFNGDGAGAYLHALPCTYLKGGRRHDMAMFAPVYQVRRFAIEDVSEGGMSRVARATEHGKVAIDLLGEHHTVAIVGQERIFQLVEGLEIKCVGHANGRSMIAVTPGDVVAVVNQAHARVVTVHPFTNLLVVAFKTQRLFVDVPFHAVIAETDVQYHASVGVVAAEHTSVAVFERYYGTVENTVGGG